MIDLPMKLKYERIIKGLIEPNMDEHKSTDSSSSQFVLKYENQEFDITLSSRTPVHAVLDYFYQEIMKLERLDNIQCGNQEIYTSIKEVQCISCGGFKKISFERKIIEYKSITNDKDNPDFDEVVNKAIKEGWQPLGGQAVVYNESQFCWDAWQAMVKYEKS